MVSDRLKSAALMALAFPVGLTVATMGAPVIAVVAGIIMALNGDFSLLFGLLMLAGAAMAGGFTLGLFVE
jgi:hypothetical protein